MRTSMIAVAFFAAPLFARVPQVEHVRPPAPGVAERLAEVSADRLRRDIDTLVAFGTRHTLSDPNGATSGIGAARRWILDEFSRAAGSLQPGFDPHQVPVGRRVPEPFELVNVVAVLPGRMPEAASRRYYVVGHFDSRASDPMDTEIRAPGANDDGSGTAVVLELARVLAEHPLDATVVFLATAGEEQGLLGARFHAQAARAAGLNIAGVISNDIVGDPTGAGGRVDRDHIRVFSEGLESSMLTGDEGDDPAKALRARVEAARQVRALGAEGDSDSRQLARYIEEVAAREQTRVRPMLVFRPDRFLRGGDHSAFNEFGFTAVRFTQVHEDYDRQHQDVRTDGGVEFGDTPSHVDEHYLAEVARVNLAAIMHLANAPSPPGSPRVLAGRLVYDTTLRWNPSPEPDVAGYEVVWRDTTSPRWEHVKDVGNVTEATIDLSKDHSFFGVRAYDHDGFVSPVVTPLPANE
ncbi:MAG: M28 family metallopeptidase [Phycisphaerales bacterium]|nr:M28 family metallopeptidase [Phycisphaerales bacterium]